jgi:hypothetical protein
VLLFSFDQALICYFLISQSKPNYSFFPFVNFECCIFFIEGEEGDVELARHMINDFKHIFGNIVYFL